MSPVTPDPGILEKAAQIATVVGGVAVTLGVLLAVRELRVIGQSQRFTGAQEFYRLLGESHAARLYVYTKYPCDPACVDRLSPEDLRQAEDAVNFLNKLVYLLDRDIVPKDLVFRMTHSMLFRLVYVLDPFVRWRQERLGARWGRRVLILGNRARRYHDRNPLHRHLPIRLERAGVSGTIYETYHPDGPRGWLLNRGRDVLWKLHRY